MYHKSLIEQLWTKNNIFVASLIFDYGSNNMSMCSGLGIKANKDETIVTVPHPGDETKLLILSTDPSHSLKGIKRMALNYEILLPDW
jgi:hypothetical protein